MQYKRKIYIFLLFLYLFPGVNFADIITVDYGVQFTNHISNESNNWTSNTHVYHDATDISYYLDNYYKISVRYNTNLQGTVNHNNTNTLITYTDSTDLDYIYAELGYSDLLLDSQRPYTYNYHTQSYAPIGHRMQTHILNSILIQDLVSDRTLDDLVLNEELSIYLYDYSDTTFEYTYTLPPGFYPSTSTVRSFASDTYIGTATILGITRAAPAALASVPEPSVIALMGLGLLGFVATRRKLAK